MLKVLMQGKELAERQVQVQKDLNSVLEGKNRDLQDIIDQKDERIQALLDELAVHEEMAERREQVRIEIVKEECRGQLIDVRKAKNKQIETLEIELKDVREALGMNEKLNNAKESKGQHIESQLQSMKDLANELKTRMHSFDLEKKEFYTYKREMLSREVYLLDQRDRMVLELDKSYEIKKDRDRWKTIVLNLGTRSFYNQYRFRKEILKLINLVGVVLKQAQSHFNESNDDNINVSNVPQLDVEIWVNDTKRMIKTLKTYNMINIIKHIEGAVQVVDIIIQQLKEREKFWKHSSNDFFYQNNELSREISQLKTNVIECEELCKKHENNKNISEKHCEVLETQLKAHLNPNAVSSILDRATFHQKGSLTSRGRIQRTQEKIKKKNKKNNNNNNKKNHNNNNHNNNNNKQQKKQSHAQTMRSYHHTSSHNVNIKIMKPESIGLLPAIHNSNANNDTAIDTEGIRQWLSIDDDNDEKNNYINRRKQRYRNSPYAS